MSGRLPAGNAGCRKRPPANSKACAADAFIKELDAEDHSRNHSCRGRRSLRHEHFTHPESSPAQCWSRPCPLESALKHGQVDSPGERRSGGETGTGPGTRPFMATETARRNLLVPRSDRFLPSAVAPPDDTRIRAQAASRSPPANRAGRTAAPDVRIDKVLTFRDRRRPN